MYAHLVDDAYAYATIHHVTSSHLVFIVYILVLYLVDLRAFLFRGNCVGIIAMSYKVTWVLDWKVIEPP